MGLSSVLKQCVRVLMPLGERACVRMASPDVLVHGSYYTTNVGDAALGAVFAHELARSGLSSQLVSRFYCPGRSARPIVFGGGGIFHPLVEGNVQFRLRPLEAGVPCLYVGVGAHRMEDAGADELGLLSELQHARYVSARDAGSCRLLERYGGVEVRQYACPAWLYAGQSPPTGALRNALFRFFYNLRYAAHGGDPGTHPVTRPRVGVSIRDGVNPARLPGLVRSLGAMASDHDLYFIPFAGEDVGFFRRHLARGPMQCLPIAGPGTTFRRVQSMDRMVATRYHALIFSLLLRKPVSVLSYAGKTRELADDLGLHYEDVTKPGPAGPLVFNEYTAGLDEKIGRKKKLARAQMDEVLELLHSILGRGQSQ